ncbi:MAG: hypothetical protein WCB99_08400 [Candidatus Cybelea sp.]|jgi:hypothetical protein
MSRPHEDIRHHTPTDHRTGGPATAFAQASWWAVTVVHVTAQRAAAALASYETLVEQARASTPKSREAALLESHNRRRVMVLLNLDGHEAFRHLTAAWDEHHLLAERHAVDESHSLELYRVVTTGGEAAIDPASTDAYAFEHVPAIERIEALIADVVAAPGFRGVVIFANDAGAHIILYRFANAEAIDTLRATPGADRYAVRPVRTFG